MARFAEPLFACSPSSLDVLESCPGRASPVDWFDGLDRHAGDSIAEEGLEQTTNGDDGDDRPREGCQGSNCPGDDTMAEVDADSTMRSCPTHLESASSSQSEDSRRKHPAIDGNDTDGVRRLDTNSDHLARSRTASHHPSCDNLRAHAFTSDTLQSSQQYTSQSQIHNRWDASSEDSGLQHGDPAQYTILSDMAETAWSVDDPRYGADVLDSLSNWDASESHPNFKGVLAERCAADRSALPFLNRQDMIESGLDMQGIDWSGLEVSRQDILDHRARLHNPFGTHARSIVEESNLSYQTERHYQFHSYHGLRRPEFAHHQLRHVLASDGRDIYYTSSGKIKRTSLSCATPEETVLDLTKSPLTPTPIRPTCLAATDSLLITGGFDGEYALTNLSSPACPTPSYGYVTHDHNSLITHIHTFPHRRSGLPQAAFCANDQRLRLMDLTTQTFTSTVSYAHSLNASATSPDARLRALAGDSPTALLTDAESGEVLAPLAAHTDHIFACAWSPDGRFLATGAQDGMIALWDSRTWKKPLAELGCRRSCARSLHFSGDSRVLVGAENEDVVSFYDTRDLGSDGGDGGRQDIWFLGTVAGVALVDGGREVVVGNGDGCLGGLMSLRRVGGGKLGGRRRNGNWKGTLNEEFVV